MAFAVECERAEKLAGADTLTEAAARKILNDIMERTATGETLRSPSVREFFKEWLESKQASKAPSTAERYGKAVAEFLLHLGERADKPLSGLAPRHIETFITKRTKAGLAPATVSLDGKVLRTAFNRARRQGLLSTNPAESVDLPSKDSIERGTFGPEEVKMLVDTAEGEWKTMILLAYFTGARLSDCCRMEWEGVDLSAGTLTFIQVKTLARITVPLHLDLLAYLEGLAGTDTAQPFISPHMADLKSGGRHGLSEGFKRIVRNAGLDLQTVQGRGTRKISRRTFHALRHSFNSALANAGVSQELRMKLSGHKTAAVNSGYTHHELKTLADAVAKMPGLKG